MELRFLLTLIFLYLNAPRIFTYKIPNVKLDILEQGFRVSIPDESGVKNVAFNINRNRPFKNFEPGDFSTQIRQAANGVWSYENKRNLQNDDVIYVWINVQHNQLVYRSIAEPIYVNILKKSEDPTPLCEGCSKDPVPTNDNTISTESSINSEDCAFSITTVPNRRVCQGEIIFEDNFDGFLNSSIWKPEIRLPTDLGDAEFVLYDTDIGNEPLAYTDDGSLKITPRLWNDDRPGTDIRSGSLHLGIRCTGNQNRKQECSREPDGYAFNVMPPVITARLNTKETFNFKYGRIEIRAKVPEGDWLYPLLLLEPLRSHYGQKEYESGQIRIAFVRGNPSLRTQRNEYIDGRTLYGGAVLSTDANKRHKYMVSTTKTSHFGADFHDYTLIWNHRELILKVDGQEYGRVSGNFSHNYSEEFVRASAWKMGDFMAPFDKEFYITLGVAAGGHGDFPDETISSNFVKPWENTSPKATKKFWAARNNWKRTWGNSPLEVDYVRVYAI